MSKDIVSLNDLWTDRARLTVIADEIKKGRLVTGKNIYAADESALFSNIDGRLIMFNNIEEAADWFIDLRAIEEQAAIQPVPVVNIPEWRPVDAQA